MKKFFIVKKFSVFAGRIHDEVIFTMRQGEGRSFDTVNEADRMLVELSSHPAIIGCHVVELDITKPQYEQLLKLVKE
jgi:hypothetical protein